MSESPVENTLRRMIRWLDRGLLFVHDIVLMLKMEVTYQCKIGLVLTVFLGTSLSYHVLYSSDSEMARSNA